MFGWSSNSIFMAFCFLGKGSFFVWFAYTLHPSMSEGHIYICSCNMCLLKLESIVQLGFVYQNNNYIILQPSLLKHPSYHQFPLPILFSLCDLSTKYLPNKKSFARMKLLLFSLFAVATSVIALSAPPTLGDASILECKDKKFRDFCEYVVSYGQAIFLSYNPNLKSTDNLIFVIV